MRDLKNILEEKTQGFHIFPRRYGIKEGKINLYGPPKSGKTSLALLISKNYKYSIYIDCKDPRNDAEMITSQILKAFLEKKINLLILDNFNNNITLPNIQNIILITTLPITTTLPDFYPKNILALNFEEYISFSSTSSSLTQLLNMFLKHGNSPINFSLLEHQKTQTKQAYIELFFKDDFLFFLQLINFQAQKITINQLYTYLKKYIKISKDKTYKILQELQEQNFIFFVEQKDSPNKAKKIYFYDFSLPYAFCVAPNFQAIFENMVFLELLYQYKKTIFYTQECHFLVEDKAFFAIPFPNQKDIEKILNKNPSKQVIIISINPLQHPQCRIIDFISFALGEYLEEK